MADREKVIKGLEEAETMLKRTLDYSGEMAVMAVMKACKCLNYVTDALEMLKEQPQIVLCKDCKHNTSSPHNPMCELDVYRSGGVDWFCADGERRTDDA